MDRLNRDTEEITLLRTHLDEITAHLSEEAPLEACGIVGGVARQSVKVFPIKNVLQSPVRYRMAPEVQLNAMLEIEEQAWDMLAIFHSHPGGPPHPSPTDVAEATYPEAVYLIFSPGHQGWDCRGFRIDGSTVSEIKIKIL